MLVDIKPNDKRWYILDDLPNEKWCDIIDYEGLYKISNYGRVKRLCRKIQSHILNHDTNMLKDKILKPQWVRDKYYNIVLTKNNKKHNELVHRLVAKCFIPNINNLPDVNHIKPVEYHNCDNRVCNLEWCSKKENTQHMMLWVEIEMVLKTDCIKHWESIIIQSMC